MIFLYKMISDAELLHGRVRNFLIGIVETEAKMAFTHLHVHSSYSLLDGSGKIPEMISRVKELGMDSCALTDHGVMYGVIDFYREAKKQGIHPILGSEIYLTEDMAEKSLQKGEARYYHLVLLAENDTGFHNLMKLVSLGFTEGYYYKPRVDYAALEKYHEGIIALSACLAGEVSRALRYNDYAKAKEAAYRYEKIFGKGNFFLEMQDHGYPEQKLVNQGMLRLHEETGIPLVATNDIHYTYKEDAKPHDILLCLQTGKKLQDEDRMRYPGGQFYIKSEEEMEELFPFAKEALENTAQIAARCQVEIEFGKYHLPKYRIPEGYDSSYSYLEELCLKGLTKRYGELTEEKKERLYYELGVIRNMGFVDYFLVVWDYINFAKTSGIAVGPGRGSAAGSIVAYAIGITDVDPIRHQLLFERFLNPERVSMPDIDVDFEYERRQEVIDYVGRKYGKEQVSQIITFGTLAARGVIRDVGRVLDVPYAKCDQLAKLVPAELNMTLQKALTVSKDLKNLYDTEEETKNMIDLCLRLEGLPRHSSMHAAGVVIAGGPVSDYVPLAKAQDGSITTQFTMTTIEELGLLKMDFLGLRTLTVIQDAIRFVEKNHGIKIDLDHLNYDDSEVYAMLSKGDCAGVFQLESSGMVNFMKRLRPSNLDDIIAGVALYRPGPMDFIPDYIAGKKNPEKVHYDCKEMEPILKNTYGVIVYQEQVMQIVRDLAGFTMGNSDLLRRAMSKKKLKEMEKARQSFVYGNKEEGIYGCLSKGISEEVANRIYDKMIDFANYAFNKSHAVSYALLSYQTAYLKRYYAPEFYAATMSSFMDNMVKTAEYIEVAREEGIPILPPDINEAEVGFSVKGGEIRYGLSAVKGVGRSAAETILEERKKGSFKNFEDFVLRMSARGLNRRAMESFIHAGSLDSLEGNRREKLVMLSEVLEDLQKGKKDIIPGQMSLSDLLGEESEEKGDFELLFPNLEEFPKAELLRNEKDALGVYLSGHPLDSDKALMKEVCTRKARDFSEEAQEEQKEDGIRDDEICIVGGLLTNINKRITKKNEMMAFLTIEDNTASMEVVAFPRTFETAKEFLTEDSKIFVKGRIQKKDEGEAKLIAEKIILFAKVPKEIWVQFLDREEYEKREAELLQILKEYKGESEVVLYLRKEKAIKRLPREFRIDSGEGTRSLLMEKFGTENVKEKTKSLKFL